jgi:hypothetical protein
VTTPGAKYAYNFTDDLAFSSLYQHTDATLGLPEPAVTAVAYNQRDEDLLTAKIDYVPSDAFKAFVKGYYRRWSSYYTEFDNGTTPYTYVPGTPEELVQVNNDNFWGIPIGAPAPLHREAMTFYRLTPASAPPRRISRRLRT